MFFRLRAILVILFFCGLSGIYPSEAAWWDIKGQIPVPPQTKEVKIETDKLEYQEFDFAHYESRLEPEQVGDFYRERLPALGWKEANSSDGAAGREGVSAAKNMPAGGDNLVFRKGNELIVIRFVSHGELPEGMKSRYILAENRITKEIKIGSDIFNVPRVVKAETPENIPVYPGAKAAVSSQENGSFQAVYLSKESPAPIASFYKSNAKSYGWQIKEERSPEKVNFPPEQARKQEYKVKAEQACHDCADKTAALPDYREGEVTDMVFSNDKNETLRLNILRFSPGGSNARDPGYTMIMVKYEK
jgi:hypothetical protein